MPTVLNYSDIDIPKDVQGFSWKDIVDGKEYKRYYALYGYHGVAVNITDGEYTYFRSPNKENQPCYEYTCIPTTIRKYLGEDNQEEIDMGRFISRTNYPVYKININNPSILDNVENALEHTSEDKLFNIAEDYYQTNPIRDEELEGKYKKLIIRALYEQLERLNLK